MTAPVSLNRVAVLVLSWLSDGELRDGELPPAEEVAELVAFADQLKPGPGQRSLKSQIARARRDRLLRKAAERFFAGRPKLAQAEALGAALLRYRAGPWLRERLDDTCPRRAGTVEAACWAILKARDHALSVRSIRAILATS